jgi:Zn-finger nucleic acid-binding protein
MDLICPKCQGTMRTYERNGVHVDQCADCRGIFLDRGELERLVDAENAWHGGAPAAVPSQPVPQPSHPQPSHQQPFQQPGHPPAPSLGSVVSEVLGQVRGSGHGSSQHSSSGYASGQGQRRKKKESFLSDLFG